MDLGELIRDAWALTWRYKFLWVLGFFAGGSAGSCAGQGFSQAFNQPDDEQFRRATSGSDVTWSEVRGDLTRWVEDNLALVLAIAAVILLILLVLTLLSTVASGGLARAIFEISEGRETSLGAAWSAGLRLFPRYLGLILIQFAVGLGLLALTAGAFRSFGLRATVLLGVGLLIFTVPYGIVVAFAQCAIAARDVGPVRALTAGARLFREQPGSSLLTWLMQLVVAIAAGIGFVVATLIATVAALILGLIVWAIAGELGVLVLLALGGIAALCLLLALAGAASTWFWAYWMLAYLRLSARRAPA